MTNNKDLDYYMAREWSYRLEEWNINGGYYLYLVNELPHCYGTGKTVQEAFDNTQKAMATLITDLMRRGQVIPEPINIEENIENSPLKRHGKEDLYRLCKEAARRNVDLEELYQLLADDVLELCSLSNHEHPVY